MKPDSSSLFLTIFIEIIACGRNEKLYKRILDYIIKSNVNLQIAYPLESKNLKISLFEHRLLNEFAVRTNIQLPKTPQEFKKHFIKFYDSIELRTNSTDFWFLIILAHVHYKTELFPDLVVFQTVCLG